MISSKLTEHMRNIWLVIRVLIWYHCLRAIIDLYSFHTWNVKRELSQSEPLSPVFLERKKNHMASRYPAPTWWITLFRTATLCVNHVQKISLMHFLCFVHMQCYLVTLSCQSTLFITIRPLVIHHYGHIFKSLYLQKGPGHTSSFLCWKKGPTYL